MVYEGGELRGGSPTRDGHRVNLKKQFSHKRLEEDQGDRGFDVGDQNVTEGRSRFGLSPEELWVGDERSLTSLPDDYVDLVFTVSVLDHIPDVATPLAEMLRVARLKVLLVELVLSRHGKITDPRVVVGYSYSHDYLSLVTQLPCPLSSHVKTPLGEGVLEYYETFELTPTRRIPFSSSAFGSGSGLGRVH